MPAIQTSYTDRPGVALEGMVANMETANSITRICETSAGIGFGRPVVQGVADLGAILPLSYVYAATGAARAGNTGNGVITASPTTGAGVKAGVYTVTLLSPTANAGDFEIEDPDGVVYANGTVGVAVTGPIGFTLADGSTDAAAGDQWTVTVVASAGGGAFRGITQRDITLVAQPGETVDLYQHYDNMGILTAGVIWVRARGTVTAGQQAYWDPAADGFKATNASTYYAPPNVTFDSSGVSGDLVKLRVSHL